MAHKCYTIRKGPDRGIHIPGCMGCAVGGHENCTCTGPAGRGSKIADDPSECDPEIEDIKERLVALEEQVAALMDNRK